MVMRIINVNRGCSQKPDWHNSSMPPPVPTLKNKATHVQKAQQTVKAIKASLVWFGIRMKGVFRCLRQQLTSSLKTNLNFDDCHAEIFIFTLHLSEMVRSPQKGSQDDYQNISTTQNYNYYIILSFLQSLLPDLYLLRTQKTI